MDDRQDGILHIMADMTVGFGWDLTYDDRQDSIIWMGFNFWWRTWQYDLDGIQHIMTDKTVGFGWDWTFIDNKTVGFGWDSTFDDRHDSRMWMGFNLW
jgi:hypothetical protein